MGVSIYYQARRQQPLTNTERTAITDIDRRHTPTLGVNASGELVAAPNWESFCIYEQDEDTEPDIIFEGATKLPLTTEGEFWEATQRWCRVLTLIRRVLADATWDVHIDDTRIAWNEQHNKYDPGAEADNV